MLSCVLVSVVFFEYYLEKIKTKLKYLIFLIPVFTMIYIHPNYLSYYSTGLKFGMYVIEPKWMIGQKGDNLIIFVNFVRRYFAVNDFRKN